MYVCRETCHAASLLSEQNEINPALYWFHLMFLFLNAHFACVLLGYSHVIVIAMGGFFSTEAARDNSSGYSLKKSLTSIFICISVTLNTS